MTTTAVYCSDYYRCTRRVTRELILVDTTIHYFLQTAMLLKSLSRKIDIRRFETKPSVPVSQTYVITNKVAIDQSGDVVPRQNQTIYTRQHLPPKAELIGQSSQFFS